jgi:hypothetical protein
MQVEHILFDSDDCIFKYNKKLTAISAGVSKMVAVWKDHQRKQWGLAQHEVFVLIAAKPVVSGQLTPFLQLWLLIIGSKAFAANKAPEKLLQNRCIWSFSTILYNPGGCILVTGNIKIMGARQKTESSRCH